MSDNPSGFVERLLSFDILLGKGDFGEAGFDTVTLKGYRATAFIVKVGAAGESQAEVRIYGLDPSIANKLNSLGSPIGSALGSVIGVRRNQIVISAGDTISGMAEVFRGNVFMAWVDFSTMPAVSFVITASVAYLAKMKPVAATSYAGSVDVAVIMQNLAVQMGMEFENNGVSVILDNPYYAGTARTQMEEAAHDANIACTIDGENGPLAIWPKDGSRNGQVLLFNSKNGLINTPTYTAFGIQFRAVFTPGQAPSPGAQFSSATTQVGRQIEVNSIYNPANGRWLPFRVAYELSSQIPDGPWEIQVDCAYTKSTIQDQTIAE